MFWTVATPGGDDDAREGASGSQATGPCAAPGPDVPACAEPATASIGPAAPGPDRLFRRPQHSAHGHPRPPCYGALDLGTNNCRLLLARPARRGFQVVDAFSRIIRLGEGVARTGQLSHEAMDRTYDALRVCATKLSRADMARSKLVATEACRVASNGQSFLDRVRDGLGLDIEILTRESEARLAVSGCAALLEDNWDLALVFDIGGGSSELIWLDLRRRSPGASRSSAGRLEAQKCIAAWTSLPIGVVTLAERFGGHEVGRTQYDAMRDHVLDMLEPFEATHSFRRKTENARFHLLGTSGTVTTLAGVHLGLDRYDRSRVDGCWLATRDVFAVTDHLLACSYDERVAEPCIGRERAEFVLAGCAILDAILEMWPCSRLRVADRGLREGILSQLMAEDGVYGSRHERPR